jgi:hypothetical protein
MSKVDASRVHALCYYNPKVERELELPATFLRNLLALSTTKVARGILGSVSVQARSSVTTGSPDIP